MTDRNIRDEVQPVVKIRCYRCSSLFTIRKDELDGVLPGTVILKICPLCGATNGWRKWSGYKIYLSSMVHRGSPVRVLLRAG